MLHPVLTYLFIPKYDSSVVPRLKMSIMLSRKYKAYMTHIANRKYTNTIVIKVNHKKEYRKENKL